jgi:riboflavin kinase/FMN adenylyltransferase
MQIAWFPDAPRPAWPRPVVALGNFDGLHRGHQKLVDEVRRQAQERAGTSVVMIFDPHPPRILRPDKAPPLLMTLDQKIEAFQHAGVDALAIVRFTPELAKWEPELFVETVLLDWLRVAEVWVGANFLFGRDRSGTFTLLRALGEDRGFHVEPIEPVRYKDFVVSSTRIRRLIEEGRVDEAGSLLGHHYFVDGSVIGGDGRGRDLGFPTANLLTRNELMPADGIYATMAILAQTYHQAVSSIGIRPTIGDDRPTIETFILEGRHEVYGAPMRLAFVKWLRPQMKFDDLAGLQAQITRDAAAAADLFAQMTV